MNGWGPAYVAVALAWLAVIVACIGILAGWWGP